MTKFLDAFWPLINRRTPFRRPLNIQKNFTSAEGVAARIEIRLLAYLTFAFS